MWLRISYWFELAHNELVLAMKIARIRHCGFSLIATDSLENEVWFWV